MARLARRHSRQRDAAAIRSHYDLGNEFYALWLGPTMAYSCAYFATGQEDLEQAQTAKFDYLCRKLRLQPGERLLDIGCGWGGLLDHAVRYYGVSGVGISLSPAQVQAAASRLAAAGLDSRCKVVVADYRDLTGLPPFDKVVSVGMCEHVGRTHLAEYFAHAYRLTRPGGLFLNHCIVDQRGPGGPDGRDREGAFIERYVFPDGELPLLDQLVREAQDAGFELRDAEALREHYVLTLRRWSQRLEAAWEAAIALVGKETCRIWRLYLAGSAEGFDRGRLNLVQQLYARPDATGRSDLPMTRSDLYAPVEPGDRS
jgi:cyclopropane-fatty-acyl-phospholipid synthase